MGPSSRRQRSRTDMSKCERVTQLRMTQDQIGAGCLGVCRRARCYNNMQTVFYSLKHKSTRQRLRTVRIVPHPLGQGY